MSYELSPLHSLNFNMGFTAGESKLARGNEGYAAYGSSNAKFLGEGYWEVFQGVTSQGAGTGSRVMKPIGNTWGGIKDVAGPVNGTGSVSEEIGRSLWGIGSGQVHIAGTNVTGFTLSTLLKLVLRSGGAYGSPIAAGLAQPSRVELGVMSTAGTVDGAVSAKIERWRPSTGGHSLASQTSETIVPQGNQVRATFPAALTGQTHWRIFFTLMRFGGQGIHYALTYNGSVDIPETVVAAGVVDGVARSLQFNWKDGDLLPIEASYDDYAPAAATHAIRLESCMLLPGAYADSTTSPTSTSTGVAIQVSKDNNYESYVPTHLLFLPERVVDTMSRPIDSYGFIACENSIHTVQYVGPREDLPSCTITTPLDVGILYQHNWCLFRSQLAIYSTEGNLMMISEDGTIDTEFAAKIRRHIKDWLPADTVLGYDPKNDGLVMFNGRECFIYSLQKRGWSLPIYLDDYGITAGSVQSCQQANRRLYITVKDGTNFTAYEFDNGAVAPVPVSFVSHYTDSPGPGVAKNIYQFNASIETNRPNVDTVVCINRNLSPIALRGLEVVNLSQSVTDPESRLLVNGMDGKRVGLFYPDIGGAGVDYLLAYADVLNDSMLNLVDELGNPITPKTSGTGVLMFIGDYCETQTIVDPGGGHIPDFFPNMPEARSFAAAVWFQANDEIGSVLDMNFYGTAVGTGRLL